MCLLCHFHTVPLYLFRSFQHLYCFSLLLSSSLPHFSFRLIFLSRSLLCRSFFLPLALPPPHVPSFLFCFHPTPRPPSVLLDVLLGAVADACLPGFWGAAGVCNDHGKTYALYAITVFRRNQDGSEDCWKTYRRYSDFHDFHMRITEQVCLHV